MRTQNVLLASTILLAAATALADTVWVDGFKYSRDVSVVGMKDGKLHIRIAAADKYFDLDKVDKIELAGEPEFNKAEQARADAASAKKLYEAFKQRQREIAERRRVIGELAEKREAQLPPATSPPITPPPATTTQPAPSEKNARASFFHVQAEGRTIVYILDHSGSMLDNFEFLRDEAIRSVRALPENSTFNVIMFSEQATPLYDVAQPAKLQATQDFAEKITTFRAQGSNDDELKPFQDAFEKAFAMKPDVIYFLTDGHFDPRLAKVIDDLNADKKTRIHTLAFVNNDPKSEKQLQAIAKQHGGTYKFISEKDLQR